MGQRAWSIGFLSQISDLSPSYKLYELEADLYFGYAMLFALCPLSHFIQLLPEITGHESVDSLFG